MKTTVTIHSDGRIVIPKNLRKELQLKPRTTLSLELVNGKLHLKRVDSADKSTESISL